MARPTDKIRIANIDPEEIAAIVDDRIVEWLNDLNTPLSPDLSVQVGQNGQSGLALTARALAHYAQSGLPVWDWQTHGEAEDACADLVRHLYGYPASAGRSSGDVGPLEETLDEADLEDPLALILVAAWSRVELSKGKKITARQLAALAGLDPAAVRRLARDGEIELEGERPARAKAKEARRWLQARGIKGL